MKRYNDKTMNILKQIIRRFTKAQNTPMTKDQLQNLIAQTKGKYFSLAFEKNDGKLRVVNAREKDLRYISGGENKLSDSPYVSVFDRNKKGWVSCRPEKVKKISCGSTVNFIG